MEDFDGIIFVLVGPEEKHFSLYKSKLCSKSKFFKAACSESWIKNKTVRQPHVTVELFRHYCEWIYSETIPANTCTSGSTDAMKHKEHMLLIRLYLFGDSLDDIKLRNEATR
jgi:hypothetical protein